MFTRASIPLLLTISLFLYGVTFWAFSPVDPDLGWHLLGGRWTSERGEPPNRDFINVFGGYWHDYHWLAQLAMFQIFKWSGFQGEMVALGVLMGVTAVMVGLVTKLSAPYVRDTYPPITPAIATLLAIGSVASHRPQLLSLLLLLCGQIIILLRLSRIKELSFFIALVALSANVHVYWVFLPILWFAYRGETLLKSKGPFSLLLSIVLISAGALVSPYGLLAPLFGWELSLTTVLSNYVVLLDYALLPPTLAAQISEFRSSLADSGPPRWVLLGSLVIAARWGGRWMFVGRRGDLWCYLLGFFLAVTKVKFIAIFGILSLPLHARIVLRVARDFPQIRELSSAHITKLIGAAAMVLFVLAVRNSPSVSYEPDDLSIMYPIAACAEVVKISNQELPVTVLASFDHGGWCRWAMTKEHPEFNGRVFVDGRTQGKNDEYFKQVFDLFGLRGNWLKTLREWNPDYAALQKDTPLAQFMALAPDQWQLVFQDGNFALFKSIPVGT